MYDLLVNASSNVTWQALKPLCSCGHSGVPWQGLKLTSTSSGLLPVNRHFFFFMTVILVSFSQPPGHLPTELFLSNQKENPFAPLHPVLVGRWAVEAFITHLTLEQGTLKLHELGFSGTVYFYFCPRIFPSQDLQIVPRGLVFLYFFTI